jgi:transcriptional regulator with XRE-family HTH domain
MIQNERQLRVAKTQAKKFEEALAGLTAGPPDEKIHPRLRQAQTDAVRAQLEDLRREIADYETLRSGQQSTLEWNSFADLPELLIRARIALGLSQRELAERLKLKEQQIQRYEATAYASASLARLLEVVRALGLEVRGDLALPVSEVSLHQLFDRLKDAGLDRDFVSRRLLPAALSEATAPTTNGRSQVVSVRIAENVGRIYGWQPTALLSREPLRVDARPLAEARFKLPARVNEPRLAAYTVYAHYLALLLLRTVPRIAKEIPTDPRTVRKEILSNYGSLTLLHALRYVWDLGVPILPLADPGSFHGAVWRSAGRNVIVLKQTTRSLARWLFDLLHELRHAGEAPSEQDRTVIEAEESSEDRKTSMAEREASEFAGQVLLDGRADEIARLCAEEAGGDVRRLKGAVQRIAGAEGVAVDALANYLAYRLSLQDINWWGAATNLQPMDANPWAVARNLLLENIDVAALNEADRELLLLALAEE